MFGNSLTIGLIAAVFLFSSCHHANSKAVESQMTIEVAKPLESIQEKTILTQSGGKVEFRGISFNYKPQIFGAVKTEEIAEFALENETDKPDNVAPQHLLFTFAERNQRSATIAVYPIDEFRRIWRPVEKNNTKIFDEDLKYLKETIKNPKFRRDGEIPFLTYYDAHQTFQAKAKKNSFQNGSGVFFLTQINQDHLFINNSQLSYFFQGLSDDGKSYILAEFPVSVSFLPKDGYVEQFEGYRIPTDKSSARKFDEYVAKMTKRLENLPANKYEPNLKYY